MGGHKRRPAKSAYWHEDGKRILFKAAQDVLNYYEPDRRCNFIMAEDLVSEAWLTSFRYGSEETLGQQYVWAKVHMRRIYHELHRQGKRHGKLEFKTRGLDEVDWDSRVVLDDHEGFDLRECIQSVATNRDERRIVGYWLRGTSCRELAGRSHRSHEYFRLLCNRVIERWREAAHRGGFAD